MKPYLFITAIAFITCVGVSGIIQAQDNLPVEVTADKALEWDRTKSTFIARGNAVVKQGDTSITAVKLTAKYKESNSGTDIQTVTATGSTVIKSNGTTGYGDGGLYDVQNGYAELTGQRPRIETETDSLAATHKIQYHITENKMDASGDVVLTRPKETLHADTMTAFFTKSPTNGQTELKQAIATGNVMIKTETETLYGDKAEYNTNMQKAIVTGNVKIEQGQNILTGDRAEFDLNANVSTLTNEGSNGRVKALFYPAKKEEGS